MRRHIHELMAPYDNKRFFETSHHRIRTHAPPLALPAFAAAPHLHAPAEQVRKHPEERLLGSALQHVQILDIGGAYPQAALGLRREVQDGSVMGGAGDEGGGHRFNLQIYDYNYSVYSPLLSHPNTLLYSMMLRLWLSNETLCSISWGRRRS